MARKKYTFVSESQVVVEVDISSTSTPDFQSVGCISGDVNVPRSRANDATTLDNWCTITQAGAVEQFTPGEISIKPTLTLDIVLGDASLDFLNDAFNNGDEISLRIKLEDAETAQSTWQLEYECVIESFDIVARGGAGETSQAVLGFHVNEVTTDTITIGQ